MACWAMAYKDILVYADATKGAEAALAAAITLATAHAAHVTALHVTPPPFASAELGPGAMTEMIRWQQERERDAVRVAETAVIAARQRTEAPVEWRLASGDVVPTLASHACYADLVIVARGGADDDPMTAGHLAGTVVMSAGRPVLVVPNASVSEAIGERVLVAWNGSREASRAIHDALPILERAKSVTVLEVSRAADASSRVAGADIARHLARHGVAVSAETAIAGATAAGGVIRRRIADIGADLVIAGAYGHTRLREFVFGGVTRELLTAAGVPVLVSH